MSSFRGALIGVLLSCALTQPGAAQGGQASASDSAFRRVQRLVNDGDVAAGRALVDSVQRTAETSSRPYIEALFWRATLAETAEQARRDYLRLAVEFSTSPRAEDALLRLAQLELSRGDRAAAKRHLERLALEHATGVSRVQGAYWMGRVLLDEGALGPACASLADARARVASGDVELANQIAYYSRPCGELQRAADSARADSAARVDSVARADSIARAQSAARAAAGARAAPGAAARTRTWSVQVAAYATREVAERLAQRLVARGYAARVTAGKPYRVRIGRYPTRDDAVRVAEKLRAANTTAIVVEAEKP